MPLLWLGCVLGFYVLSTFATDVIDVGKRRAK